MTGGSVECRGVSEVALGVRGVFRIDAWFGREKEERSGVSPAEDCSGGSGKGKLVKQA